MDKLSSSISDLRGRLRSLVEGVIGQRLTEVWLSNDVIHVGMVEPTYGAPGTLIFTPSPTSFHSSAVEVCRW